MKVGDIVEITPPPSKMENRGLVSRVTEHGAEVVFFNRTVGRTETMWAPKERIRVLESVDCTDERLRRGDIVELAPIDNELANGFFESVVGRRGFVVAESLAEGAYRVAWAGMVSPAWYGYWFNRPRLKRLSVVRGEVAEETEYVVVKNRTDGESDELLRLRVALGTARAEIDLLKNANSGLEAENAMLRTARKALAEERETLLSERESILLAHRRKVVERAAPPDGVGRWSGLDLD